MNRKKEDRDSTVLSDDAIVELYWNRNERAITETDRKYKRYLYSIAYNILNDHLDSEECLNDTYLGTWNRIPPTRPNIFQIFLSKIMRNTALSRYKRNTALKRIPSELTISLEELGECIPTEPSTEEEYLVSEVSRIVSNYLRTQPERRVFVFICRYWCADRIEDIAEMLKISESTVHRELCVVRNGLKGRLKKEGYICE